MTRSSYLQILGVLSLMMGCKFVGASGEAPIDASADSPELDGSPIEIDAPPQPPTACADDGATTDDDLDITLRYYDTPMVWEAARKACSARSAQLAILDSSDKRDFALGLYDSSGRIRVSVGMTDLAIEGEWRWLDNSLFDEFEGMRPNGQTAQNCGGLDENGDLDDEDCGRPFTFLCECLSSDSLLSL